ncbi:hypothetical protein GGD63_005926 [Bradyrhizobium sp. cir1]|nr:hypothetical protein [Bradyrhizobium sp. cir1]
MLTPFNRPYWEQSARDWTMRLGALMPQPWKKPAEPKPQRPPWRHFDDTHHWDSTAEEWVPNHDR